MAIDPALQTLLLELFASYDPSLDTAEGTSIRTEVIDPFLIRVGGNPLDTDVEALAVDRVLAEVPGVDVSELSDLRDLVIRACTVIIKPYRRELEAVKLSQSLQNYRSMSRDEVNALLANFFTQLQDGVKARGVTRVYYPAPRSVVVSPLTQFSTGTGLNFFPTIAQSVSATQMSFNQEGNLYFADFLLQAERSGDEYNVASGSIISVVGLTGVSRVTNLAPFEEGDPEETKEEGIARAQNSITTRNLITEPGVKFVLPENFPSIDTLQVIGFGDAEMMRDVITGPITISDIPGGISGAESVDVSGGPGVHIGGKTDIYVYQLSPDSDVLDIQNITDQGFRIYAGSRGFTAPGSPTTTFQDERGFFITRGVVAGDLLRLDDQVYEIVSRTETTLVITAYQGGDPTIAEGLFGKTYEVVRKTEGVLTIPLYDLVALDADGVPVLDPDDNPLAPIPGSATRASSGEIKTYNIALANISVPVLRVRSVERLDPLTLEASGIFLPMRDCLLVKAVEAFTGGGVSTKATGTLRAYFRDAVNAWVTRSTTLFTYEARTFVPVTEGTSTGSTLASGTSGGSTITVAGGNFTPSGTGVFREGSRITIPSGDGAGTYTVIGGAFSSPNTILTIREELPATFASASWTAHAGCLEEAMEVEESTGLYYLDIEVEATLNGSGGNLPAETEVTATDLYSEGWSLRTGRPVESFSTREEVYLELTSWVNDTFQLDNVLDAPALRLAYQYAGDLADIQTFCDSSANRVVAEDTLVRHFLPAYVSVHVEQTGLDAEVAAELLTTYINETDPTLELKGSDLVQVLGDETYTKLPFSLVALTQDTSRRWGVTISQDKLGSNRVQHYVADNVSAEVV